MGHMNTSRVIADHSLMSELAANAVLSTVCGATQTTQASQSLPVNLSGEYIKRWS